MNLKKTWNKKYGKSEMITKDNSTCKMVEIDMVKLANGENAQDLAEKITEATGMNRNSAIMYLYAVQGMLDGVIYKRSINATAMKRYFDWIYNEYGSQGLKKAIHATRLHVDYRRSCGHMVDSIEEICNRYERKL